MFRRTWCWSCALQAELDHAQRSGTRVFCKRCGAWCGSRLKGTDVLPRLQDDRDRTPAGSGWACSCSCPMLLMFCYSFWSVSSNQTIVHAWNLENYKELLQKTVYWQTLLRSMWIAARVMMFSLAAGISAGVLSFVLRGQTKGSAVPDGDHPALGQLSGAGVCVEDNPRLDGVLNTLLQYCASDSASAGLSALQPVRRGADADAHLYAVHVSADLRGAGAHSAQPGGGVARSGRDACADVLEGDLSAVDSRGGRRSDVRVRLEPRRLSGAAAAGRAERNHDLEHRRQLVRCSL